MKAFVRIYLQQFKTTFAAMLQYRAALIIWMIGHVLEPLVYLIVWSTVSLSGDGNLGVYNPRTFAAYFIVLMLVNHITFTWIMYEYEYRVREGRLSFALLRPVHPIHSDIADNISFKVITMPLMLLIAVVLALLFRPVFSTTLWAVGAFLPALFFAFLLRFLFEWTLAQAAFWTTRVNAFNQMYFVVLLFLSGQIAPLILFPRVFQIVADVLPFYYMIGFPVELVLGRLSLFEMLSGFGAQIVWLVIGFVLHRFVWSAGVRLYSAVGA